MEQYGADHWQQLNYSANLLNWRAAGFTKMQDFWDRDFYTGNTQALNDDKNNVSGKKLGLAEFSNGNFIGRTTTYREYFKLSDKDYSKHYFPYPSLQTSTDYPKKRTTLGNGVRTVLLKDEELVNRIYLDKTGDGISFANHSALTYLGAYTRKSGRVLEVSSTIQDDNVLKAYHDILIPKAVEYSAGILDYFFRGTLDVGFNWDTNTDIYTFTNKNTSGQDFYNGAFSLFEEDASGNRSLVQHTNLSDMVSGGILPDGSSANMTYPGPAPSGTKFLVVYQGTIGQTNNSALDPVDANISIAAARPAIEQTINYPDDYFSVGGFGMSISTNLDSLDFGFIPSDFQVIINSAIFDDSGSIGDVNAIPSPIGGGYPATISYVSVDPAEVSVVGNHLSVNLTATDIFGIAMGYQNVSITWRAFPPQ